MESPGLANFLSLCILLNYFCVLTSVWLFSMYTMPWRRLGSTAFEHPVKIIKPFEKTKAFFFHLFSHTYLLYLLFTFCAKNQHLPHKLPRTFCIQDILWQFINNGPIQTTMVYQQPVYFFTILNEHLWWDGTGQWNSGNVQYISIDSVFSQVIDFKKHNISLKGQTPCSFILRHLLWVKSKIWHCLLWLFPLKVFWK